MLHNFLGQLSVFVLSFVLAVLVLGVVLGLHLRLFEQHPLLELVKSLLLLDLHLVDNSPVFLAQLLDVIHKLFICLLGLQETLLEVRGLFLKVSVCLFELL